MLEFHKYQAFPSAEAAQPFLRLLRQHSVPFEAELDTGEPVFNPAMTFGNTYSTYVVKLHGADFEWVRRLEEDANRHLLDSLSPDHYLFGFSDVELFDLLANPAEWSNLDVILAGQLLRQRGRDVSPDAIRLLRQHRVAVDVQPERSNNGRILWGYGLALLGGVVAIFMGWELYSHKKTLHDGRQVLAHSAQDRVHGMRIMALGVVSLLFWVVVRVWVLPAN